MSIIKDIFSKYKKIFFKSSSNDNKNNSEADEEGLIDAKKTKGAKNKKKIENIATFIVILIITVIMINNILKEDDSGKNETSTQYKQLVDNTDETSMAVADISVQTDLERELEDILTKMDGVGEVEVLVTYSQTSRVVPVYNETNRNSSTKEEDSEGGTRLLSESDTTKEVVLDSNNDIITESVMLPEIEGAIVMAKGASNIEIKNNIIQAVSAVTGLATHKVQVFEISSN